MALGVAAVAVVDYATAGRFPLEVFYVPGVLLAGWRSGLSWGIPTAVACSVLPALVDVWAGGVARREALIDAAVHAVFFASLAVVAARLRSAYAHQRHLATTDWLTGLPNSRALRDAAPRLLAEARRRGCPLAVAMLDCDNFKAINDALGHHAGDDALRHFAAALTAPLRGCDLAARVGGDEFAILLPDCDAQQARRIFDDVRNWLQSAAAAPAMRITASIGVAVFTQAPEHLETALRAADALMYQIKASTKNNVNIQVIPGSSHSMQTS